MSKRGKVSPKRNGLWLPCTGCGVSVYKNQRDLKRAKQHFCGKGCWYRFNDRGLTSERKRFQKTAAYIAWRRHVFQRDDYTCQACGQRGGKLHADHLLPYSKYPDLRLEILNGQTLCVPCHQSTPTWGSRVHTFDALVD